MLFLWLVGFFLRCRRGIRIALSDIDWTLIDGVTSCVDDCEFVRIRMKFGITLEGEVNVSFAGGQEIGVDEVMVQVVIDKQGRIGVCLEFFL